MRGLGGSVCVCAIHNLHEGDGGFSVGLCKTKPEIGGGGVSLKVG